MVEVVLAIGLATFALLVIVSLMPAGLRSLQESNQQIVQTEIFNTMGSELAKTRFGEVEDFVLDRFPIYFDNEGLEVEESGDAVYFVRCTLRDPELGGGELRRATVTIGYRRDPESDATGAARRTFLLVDRGL